jgi:hypothetical protein
VAGVRAKIDWALSVDHVTDLLINNADDEVFGNFLNTLCEAAQLIAAHN